MVDRSPVSRRTGTVTQRAEQYFGLQREPRTSVKLGVHTVAIVAGEHLYLYEEAGKFDAHGTYVSLTNGKMDDLIAALEAERPDA